MLVVGFGFGWLLGVCAENLLADRDTDSKPEKLCKATKVCGSGHHRGICRQHLPYRNLNNNFETVRLAGNRELSYEDGQKSGIRVDISPRQIVQSVIRKSCLQGHEQMVVRPDDQPTRQVLLRGTSPYLKNCDRLCLPHICDTYYVAHGIQLLDVIV